MVLYIVKCHFMAQSKLNLGGLQPFYDWYKKLPPMLKRQTKLQEND